MPHVYVVPTLAVPTLFVTGTDTGVGKTYVTALLAAGLTATGRVVGVYKPAVSGAVTGPDGQPVWGDVEALHQATGGRWDRNRIAPQRFLAPLAPPAAAAAEDRRVDTEQLRAGAAWWAGRCDVLLIEGVGGLLCPLTPSETVADLVADLAVPLLVIARAGLGTINHTLLTLEVAQGRGLPVAGVILNQSVCPGDDPSVAGNADEIARRSKVPVLARVPYSTQGGSAGQAPGGLDATAFLPLFAPGRHPTVNEQNRKPVIR